MNQAARFEPANKSFGTHIIIGEPTYQLAKDKIEARFLALLVAKGKTEPVRAYELLAKKGGLSGEQEKLVVRFEEAWDLFASGKFQAAIDCFKSCLEIDPDDGPSKVYIKICEEYLVAPPRHDWRGEWLQEAK
ncbi:MAG TPA: hypothetical protein EYP19_17055 [Desulfobacterales bacterium]|nr:hypothetical protein [Desulfobacterales bacterium]